MLGASIVPHVIASCREGINMETKNQPVLISRRQAVYGLGTSFFGILSWLGLRKQEAAESVQSVAKTGSTRVKIHPTAVSRSPRGAA